MQATLPAIKHIALVAHDRCKAALLAWAKRNQATLIKHKLFATNTTGLLLEKELGLSITKFCSGPLGGDQQTGAAIVEGRVNCLIFFWDPLESLPHDPDVKALLRLASVWNIPVACNETSADFIMSSPLFAEDYARNIPDVNLYLERSIK